MFSIKILVSGGSSSDGQGVDLERNTKTQAWPLYDSFVIAERILQQCISTFRDKHCKDSSTPVAPHVFLFDIYSVDYWVEGMFWFFRGQLSQAAECHKWCGHSWQAQLPKSPPTRSLQLYSTFLLYHSGPEQTRIAYSRIVNLGSLYPGKAYIADVNLNLCKCSPISSGRLIT